MPATAQLPDHPVDREPAMWRPLPLRSWRDHARCARGDVDPELFFGQDGETQAERRARIATAQRVCHACPVRTYCVADSLAAGHVEHGIRGAETAYALRTHYPRSDYA